MGHWKFKIKCFYVSENSFLCIVGLVFVYLIVSGSFKNLCKFQVLFYGCCNNALNNLVLYNDKCRWIYIILIVFLLFSEL